MIRYQWRLNGRPLANQGRVQGADTDRLVVTNLSAADDGHVDVVVTNPCGTAVSPAAVLKVAAVRGCPADIADRWGAPGPDGRVDHHDLLLFLAWF
ncbi:MAG: hypothetical protein K2Q09_01845, partial [Phycisphaerales bacterium]|nr:hypothetical protein [Phycisphaerales bacterium]